MISREIVDKLTSLGFKEYEARVYAALVLYGPSKAGEISLRSGVPRPRVYDVLRDLIAKGFVERTQGSPTYYRAVDPEHVIGELRDRYVRSAEDAIIELKTSKRRYEEKQLPILYLEGEWSIRNNLKLLVERTESDLIIGLADGRFGLRFRGILSKTNEKGVYADIILLKPSRYSVEHLRLYGRVYAVDPDKVKSRARNDELSLLADKLLSSIETYSVKAVLVSDGRESIMVYHDGGVLKALNIRLPFIPLFQRTVLKWVAEVYGSVL
ncbi:hypothetical protein apy_16390 [Aeropyrum pernix]|uniref:Transcription regulator TrmB N-terminal domain-containing protein n=1 Tax=Aeropyrum pernix TaxID=56636 RepID=A0A401HBZ5_AERPX|nr:helix-turn-helix domain-containing protein [Aeropyrum pernix]GBF09914.1 hypothetical protein apy_16390 [Aeropyrum pernix]